MFIMISMQNYDLMNIYELMNMIEFLFVEEVKNYIIYLDFT